MNDYPLGAAYLYQKSSYQWSQVRKISPSDSINTMGFGSAVFLKNDYLIISANHDYCNSSGTASIYKNDGLSWNEIAFLEASGSPICDHYGCSVGINEDGNHAAVGAFNDDESGEGSGAVYVYQQTANDWTLQDKIMAFDGEPGDGFGFSTFITNDFLFVGTPLDSEDDEYSGAVYIYQNTGAGWEYLTKLTASQGTDYSRFGYSVSVDNDLLIVGTLSYDQGRAFIYRNVNSNWIEEVVLTANDSFIYDMLGRSVSVSGDHVLIGACDVPDVGMSASAYFFKREGAEWNQVSKFTLDDWGAFGYSVSISGENAIVGASLDWGANNSTGAAYLINYEVTSSEHESVSLKNNYIRNYPNPFCPSINRYGRSAATTIQFSSELFRANEQVSLEIYNLKGQKIYQFDIRNSQPKFNEVVWNGDDEEGRIVASGIYLYRLNSNGITKAMGKCLLLK